MNRFSLFSESRERMATALQEAVSRLLPAVLMVLQRNAERAIDLKARVELQEAHHELSLTKQTLPAEVAKRFNELVFKRLEIESSSPREDLAGGLLALLPEADLDEQIYADDLAQRIRAAGGEEYAALIARTHLLTGFSHQEDRCPLSAGIFAAALIQALRRSSRDRLVWAAIRPELSVEFPNDLASAMADVNDYLRQHNILVELPRFIAKVETLRPAKVQTSAKQSEKPEAAQRVETSAVPLSAPSPNTQPGLIVRATSAVDKAIQVARDTGRHNLKQAENPVQRALLAERMTSIANLEAEGTSFAKSVKQAPYSRGARAEFFAQLRQSISATQLDASQGAVIDVVQSMFDYAVDDKQVPDAALPLLWRMQLPAVLLSLLDSRYLGDQPNSVRRLVENLSAIVMAFPDDVFKGSELFTRLETAVRAVEVVAHTLHTRAGVLAGLIEKQFADSAKGVAMIAQRVKTQRISLESMPERRNRRDHRRRPSREAEQLITENLNSTLSRKMAGQAIPESVRQFLATVWMRRLRTTALRDGEESPDYLVSLKVVDDLLWTLSDKHRGSERKKLAVQIPPLIKQLTDGVVSVGVDKKELDAFFDELFIIHLRRMQREQLTLSGSSSLATIKAPVKEPTATADSLEVPQSGTKSFVAVNTPSTVTTVIAKEVQTTFDPDFDLPVLGAELALPELPELPDLAQSVVLPISEPIVLRPDPVIPSLADIAPNQLKTPVKSGLVVEKIPRPAKATRVSVTASLGSYAKAGSIRISGMDQLAAAASINLMTIPGKNSKKRRSRDDTAIRQNRASTEESLGLQNELPTLPSLTMPALKGREPQFLPPQNLPQQAAATEWDASASERKLLELLDTVEISEGHVGFVRRDLGAEEALDLMQVGAWIELIAGPDGSRFGKIAWINDRRTVVLVVRENDRKALSLRSGELLSRFSERRAFLLKPGVEKLPRDLH